MPMFRIQIPCYDEEQAPRTRAALPRQVGEYAAAILATLMACNRVLLEAVRMRQLRAEVARAARSADEQRVPAAITACAAAAVALALMASTGS